MLSTATDNKQVHMAFAPNQPIVITLPNSNSSGGSNDEQIVKKFPKKLMLTCGILQLSCAASVAIIQVDR